MLTLYVYIIMCVLLGEIWTLEHYTTNNINSDTVATDDVASTKIDTP